MTRRHIREVKRELLLKEPYCYVFCIVRITWDDLFFWRDEKTVGLFITKNLVFNISSWYTFLLQINGNDGHARWWTVRWIF